MTVLKEEAKKRKITNKNIAMKLNISPSQVSNYYKLNYRISFYKFYQILKIIFQDDYININEFIIKFIDKNTKTESFMEAMEWAANFGKYKIMDLILKKKNEPFFRCYKLLRLRIDRKIKPANLFREIEKIKYECKSVEEKIICQIASLYALYDSNSFNPIIFLSEDLLEQVKELDNEYLQESYKIRILELSILASMKKKNLLVAEEYAKELISSPKIEEFPIQLSYVFNLLSEMYIFTDYKKSIMYNQKAMNVFKRPDVYYIDRKRKTLEATSDFINIFHRQLHSLYLTDPAEAAHYLAVSGGKENSKRAIEILNWIEKNNQGLSAFQTYYKAIATKDITYLQEALEKFIISGDSFYAQLPQLLLSRQGT